MKPTMLFYAGHVVHELYKTLITNTEADEEYDNASKRLRTYFEPTKNQTCEIYHFRKMCQDEPSLERSGDHETIGEFVHLHTPSVFCNKIGKMKNV